MTLLKVLENEFCLICSMLCDLPLIWKGRTSQFQTFYIWFEITAWFGISGKDTDYFYKWFFLMHLDVYYAVIYQEIEMVLVELGFFFHPIYNGY